MKYSETISRTYENATRIDYEYLSASDIYIHLIQTNFFKREGRGTEALKAFLEEFQNYNIYLYSSDECGTKKETLDNWYEKNGFKKCTYKNLKYNVTHMTDRTG